MHILPCLCHLGKKEIIYIKKCTICNALIFNVLHDWLKYPAEAMLLHAEVALLRAEEPPLHPPC